MKLTKLISSVLLASVCMSVFCCGCTNTKEPAAGPDDGGRQTVKRLPKDEVLIIDSYHNAAWGTSSNLSFIVSDGSVYSSSEYFDGFPDNYGNSLSEEDKIALLRKYTLPVATIEKERLLKIYNNIINIDTDAEFVYDDMYACDAGTSVTKVNVGGEWVKINESGDRSGELDDRFARKTNALLGGAYKSVSGNRKDAAHVYSGYETFLNTFECTKNPSKDLRRIITSPEELKAFEKDTGINLENNECFAFFGDPDYDSFQWMCICIEVVNYPEYLSLDDVSADAFIVSGNYTGFVYVENPVIDVSDDVVPQKCYCHVVQLPANDLSEYDQFLVG